MSHKKVGVALIPDRYSQSPRVKCFSGACLNVTKVLINPAKWISAGHSGTNPPMFKNPHLHQTQSPIMLRQDSNART